ncbi:hypothetical protein Taro_037874, partial [Colocasia esculenta]|nr:hypothetical protein [Colocasia esculenta]
VLETVAHIEGEQEETYEEIIPNIPAGDVIIEGSQEAVFPEVVAPGHSEDVPMEDAPFQGEPVIQEEADVQGEPTISAPVDKHQEGLVDSTSDGNDDDVVVELVGGSEMRGRHTIDQKKKRIHVRLKPIINRLNAHGEILCSVQSDITSIFLSQSIEVNEIEAVKSELQEMKTGLGRLKNLVTNLSEFVRVQLTTPAPPAPTQPVAEEPAVVWPPRPFEEESGPPGPTVKESGPPGPSMVESGSTWPLAVESGPSKPVESEAEQATVQEHVEEAVVPPESPVPSPLQTTFDPSTPPSSSTAPPAPETFKQPLPKHISSPTPFPTTFSSSPISSTVIPPTTFEEPPTSSLDGPLSAGPSAAQGSVPPPTTSLSSFQRPTPPSFITIIPKGARVQGHIIQDIKDEFEEAIICSVLSVSSHVHRTSSSNPAPKKRKVDFATLQFPDVVFLPKLHSLLMDSAMGPIIFERFARVMARITVRQGVPLAFHRFLFREYHMGFVKSDVLAPLLSECERLSPSEWEKHYHQAAQQLDTLNSFLFRSGKPSLSVEKFLDLNSINLVQDPFALWIERYKVYEILKRELKQNKIFYPISIDKFLQHASFGTISHYQTSLGKEEYANFIEAQRQLHIQRMLPDMGPSYSMAWEHAFLISTHRLPL